MKNILFQVGLVILASAALVGGLLLVTYEGEKAPELILDEAGQVEEIDGPLAPDVINQQSQAPMTPSNAANPVAVFTTNRGVIEVELYQDLMPITVGNFTKLISEGFYNGTQFHRVIPNFMIQAGDPNTKGPDAATYGTGGPGYTIQDEFVTNPLLTNTRGSLAMANTGQPNSGGSQFFINTVDNVFLDFDKEPLTSRHPVFGRVIGGMDVVDAISATQTGPRDLPVDPVVIETITLR